MLRYTMSINEACPSVSTILIPSAQRLKPVSNPAGSVGIQSRGTREIHAIAKVYSSSANTSAVCSHFKVPTLGTLPKSFKQTFMHN